ncbi:MULTISPECIES: thermonuclease family protein [Rhizobium/Agrobacterium group]|uniref:thermonuclease family protein n=1 Tax=Rhizobium/Agrobacterium group TaxID=227290 RepID=UPI001ADD185F|nr:MULTISPECIES: thermonuclease family protein [Rhizobium/Agrobacterium group]MBO9111887.1 thermonuclease family protein [Agrobacterium sp. S2/73]QXZ76251.1 thermonuclease family protein [Agrobacterium sp. S7/73]QYA17202.1 thermonuclease family protein [Rhizobium sp. AB2/73]UEQ85224.1 thermonuclease family protein [Rhizobium sp. AB2/73]
MLISTIAVSGLYASITLVPMLAGAQFPRGVSPRIVPVQASAAERAVAGDKGTASSEFVPFPAQAQFETGDSWVSGGRRYRLYGLQACLRGTSIRLSGEAVRDCGELNVIMTQALVRDTRPVCARIQEIDQNNTVVACQTTAGQHRYDLATYMIAQGWGFAAVDGAGQLIVPGYRVAEDSARAVRAGLWAYSDLPHPVTVLMQQAETSR